MNDLEKIFTSDKSDIEKITQSFGWIINNYVAFSGREIELLKAMGDRENLVKEQIKLNTIKHMQSVFAFCFLRTTGKKAWDEITS